RVLQHQVREPQGHAVVDDVHVGKQVFLSDYQVRVLEKHARPARRAQKAPSPVVEARSRRANREVDIRRLAKRSSGDLLSSCRIYHREGSAGDGISPLAAYKNLMLAGEELLDVGADFHVWDPVKTRSR